MPRSFNRRRRWAVAGSVWVGSRLQGDLGAAIRSDERPLVPVSCVCEDL